MRSHPVPLLLAAIAAACSAPSSGPAPLRPLRPDTLENNGWGRDCDLLSVTVNLDLDFRERRVQGTATSRVRALLSGTSWIRLHAVGLEIRTVRDAAGRELAFELDEPWLDVELSEPLGRGEEEDLAVEYSVTRPERGLYFVETSKDAGGFAPQIWSQGQEEDNRYWLPIWDFPSDRATFEARLRVDEDMVAVSNGRLLEVVEHGGGERTYHWLMEREVPTYLFAIACGRWELYADAWRDVPIEYYVAPGTGEEKARRAFGETPEMMAFFSDLLGVPYPYSKYAQVAVAEFPWGGMENVSLTIQNDFLIGSAAEIGDLDGDPRLLVAHELAHQWFGNLVTCFGWSHLWLNEAWASYLELLFERHKTSEGNFRLWLERYREWYMVSASSRVPVSLDWFSQGAGPRANHVYWKGPWILYMIHRTMGDEAFWIGVRSYLERHQGRFVTSEDFVRALFDATGFNVEGLVEQWVEAGGYPVYDVRFRERKDTLELEVRQRQDVGALVPLFDMAVAVDLWFADGRAERHELAVREREQTFRLPMEGELIDVVFDPECAVLCDVRVEKPTRMWAHQAMLEASPPARWRALAPLRARAQRSELARRAILAVLLGAPEPLLRERAARYCDFRDPRAFAALVEAVTTDSEVRVRREAAHALVQHTLRSQFDPDGADYARLLAHLGQETSPSVQEKLTALLGLEP